MSKQSERKKARRRKRLAVREAKALPDWAFGDEQEELELAPRNVTDVLLGVGNLLDDGYPDEVAEVVDMAVLFERRITQRGWTFDCEFSHNGFANWFFAPSGTELEDETLEPVTRVWLTVFWDALHDPNDFPDVVNVLLVGSGEKDLSRRPTTERFFELIDAIEAYRIGDPRPVFGD